MALILDESFLTGIPANFATPLAQSGTLSATYNAAAQAVDLSNLGSAQNCWAITSSPLQQQGEMEADLELLADTYNYQHLGLWLTTGAANASDGIRYAHFSSTSNSYSVGTWGGPGLFGSESGGATVSNTGFPFPIGTRRTFKVRWKLTSGMAVKVETYIDDQLKVSYNPSFASFRAGIFLYGATVRVHQIKVWDAPTVPFREATFRGFQPLEGSLSSSPIEALDSLGPRNRTREQVRGSRNIHFAGNGRITGTVKEKGTASNVPVHRRVVLIDERTRLLVQEQWSDATTGVYNFIDVDHTHTFTVLSYDHTGAFRAVVADGQIPELIP